MKVNFPVTLTAADSNARTLTGRIVTWGETGFTSAGKTIFAENSISIPKNVKLLLEHDRTRPIGKLLSYEVTPQGIEASFKIAGTIAGDDSLLEAAEGLRDGFSVGIKLNEWENVDGSMVVKSSSMIETSLVTEPAIDSARVSEVAASENEVSETTVSDVQPEGEQVSDTTVPEVAPAAETVEAAKSEVTVSASAPVAYTTPRVNLNVTAGQYAKAQLAASRGDSDARDLIAALQVATVAENTGMVPPNYLKDVIGVIDSSRPFIDSIERAALPASGMKIFTPKLGAQATVALTAEGAEFSSTDTAVTFQEDNVVKFAGAGRLDVELVDRSDPSFLDLYIRELAASYAMKTDAYAANIAAQNSAASTGSTIYKSIADGIADSFGVMRMTPNRLLVAAGGGVNDIDFSGLLGAVDSTGRPIFAAAAPTNANGLISQGSTAGTVAGLSLVVDPNYTGNDAGAKYALVYPSNAMRFHESSQIQLRTAVVANGQLDIGLYGYAAVVNRYPTAFRYLTVA
ncbi:Prohead protease [uncultured Caudovirales phage]|uniref:Prohead protease n=3 Tax=uncultured Caudovirales phage TaxID=2100421 RepID=A0A6J5PXQ6_9CAUD|nr:Prohead protease [uncultured Caudovirales phage]